MPLGHIPYDRCRLLPPILVQSDAQHSLPVDLRFESGDCHVRIRNRRMHRSFAPNTEFPWFHAVSASVEDHPVVEDSSELRLRPSLHRPWQDRRKSRQHRTPQQSVDSNAHCQILRLRAQAGGQGSGATVFELTTRYSIQATSEPLTRLLPSPRRLIFGKCIFSSHVCF